jgi:ABC-type sugar transport system ATPase subunit
MVEIAKTISRQVKILIMDEPTSALSETEAATLFEIIGELKQTGIGIIFISHRLEEVLEVCDRITVLRDGQHVGDTDVEETSKDELITMMVGRSLDTFFHEEEIAKVPKQADVILEVKDISRTGTAQDPEATVLDNVSFNLRRGEILGFAGLVGAGRTELARTIFGADKRESGEIFVDGKRVAIDSPQHAIAHGIGLLPEDRKEQGLILEMAVGHNMTLVDLDEFTQFGFVRRRKETSSIMDYVHRFQIRTPDIDRRVVNLSGGNQQKVVISKWLMVRPKILIMDEPTRGIDVGAKSDIYDLMHQLAAEGIGLIMISSEFPELLAMCDRIVCLTEGRVTAILPREEASLETLMHYCTMRERAIIAEGTAGTNVAAAHTPDGNAESAPAQEKDT